MSLMCGALSFLGFCASSNLMTNVDFEGHLKYFSSLDVVLSVPVEVCPLTSKNLMQFKAAGQLAYDERLEGVVSRQKISRDLFVEKIKNCAKSCTCGALLTLEDRVSPKLNNVQSKKLQERLELLTNDYYSSCQKKIQLSCNSELVKEISRNASR